MGKMPTPPQLEAKRFDCPKCGAFAAQDWRALHYVTATGDFNQEYFGPIQDSSEAGGPSTGHGKRWQASLCAGCEDHSLWIGNVLVYPSNRDHTSVPEPADGMPEQVEELYQEAAAVLPHSRRAAAALCRASLERLARILTPEAKARTSLDDRLVHLHGKTTASLGEGLQFIRHAGNTALHGAHDDDESVVIYMGEDEAGLIDLFFITINELVDELITRPARINAAYNLIPREKREAVDRKIKLSQPLDG